MSSKRAAHNMTAAVFARILENKRIKTPKVLEQYMKGAANHRRIQILFYVAKNSGVTMDQIAEVLNCNPKTISGHTQKLVHSGLLVKKYMGQNVLHSLTPEGSTLLRFLSSF